MKGSLWAISASGCLALVVNGWDRVSHLAGRVNTGFHDKAGEISSLVMTQLGRAPAADLQSLVAAEGSNYRFRRDLPFPAWLSVDETETLEVTGGRLYASSVVGDERAAVNGTFERSAKVASGNGRVEWTLVRSNFTPTILQSVRERQSGGLPEALAPLVMPELEGKSVQLWWSGKEWHATTENKDDFRLRAWGQDLRGKAGDLLVRDGMMPRSMWFGERPLALGTALSIEGKQVAMLTGYPADGSLRMKFERVESLDGHPCGVFTWQGEIKAKNVARIDGPLETIDWKVREGTAWMSLIYPLVLQSDAVGLREVSTGEGSATVRWQGEAHESFKIKWRGAQ